MQSTTSGERGMAGAMQPIILSLTATVPSRNIHVLHVQMFLHVHMFLLQHASCVVEGSTKYLNL